MKFPEIIILRDKYRLGCCRVDPGAVPHPTSSLRGRKLGRGQETRATGIFSAAQAAKIRSVIAGHLFRLPATKTPEMCDNSDCSRLGNLKSERDERAVVYLCLSVRNRRERFFRRCRMCIPLGIHEQTGNAPAKRRFGGALAAAGGKRRRDSLRLQSFNISKGNAARQ